MRSASRTVATCAQAQHCTMHRELNVHNYLLISRSSTVLHSQVQPISFSFARIYSSLPFLFSTRNLSTITSSAEQSTRVNNVAEEEKTKFSTNINSSNILRNNNGDSNSIANNKTDLVSELANDDPIIRMESLSSYHECNVPIRPPLQGLPIGAYFENTPPANISSVAHGRVTARLSENVYAVQLQDMHLSPVIELGSRVYVEYGKDENTPGTVLGGLVVRVNSNGTFVILLDNNSLDLAVPSEMIKLAEGRAKYINDRAYEQVLEWVRSSGVTRHVDQESMACVLYQRGWRVDKLYLLEGADVHCMTYIPKSVRMCILDKSEWQRDHHRQMRQLLKERVKERDFRYRLTKYSGVVSASMAFLGIAFAFGWNVKNHRRQQRKFQLSLAIKTLYAAQQEYLHHSHTSNENSSEAMPEENSLSESSEQVVDAAVTFSDRSDISLGSTLTSPIASVAKQKLKQEIGSASSTKATSSNSYAFDESSEEGAVSTYTNKNKASTSSKNVKEMTEEKVQMTMNNNDNNNHANNSHSTSEPNNNNSANVEITEKQNNSSEPQGKWYDFLRYTTFTTPTILTDQDDEIESKPFVIREREEQAMRQVLRQLDTAHPRVVVLTGYFGCGKSALCRSAIEKEQMPAINVDIRGPEDSLRSVVKALGVENVDVCGDLPDFIAEACQRFTKTSGRTPLFVLKLREKSNFKRVYNEAVALACDRRLCHLIIEVPMESLTMANASLPRLDFYTVPNFTRSQAYQYTQHSIDPLSLSVFLDVVGTNSNDLDMLFAAVHQRRVSPTEYTNHKLLKAMRQLHNACGAQNQVTEAVSQLARFEFDDGQHAGVDSTSLNSASLKNIVIYDPVRDTWLFRTKIFHTAARCMKFSQSS